MLFWADVELTGAGEDQLPQLLDDVARRVRARYEGSALTDDPTVTALRKLFRRAGNGPDTLPAVIRGAFSGVSSKAKTSRRFTPLST